MPLSSTSARAAPNTILTSALRPSRLYQTSLLAVFLSIGASTRVNGAIDERDR